jgi:hypothetical protein
MNNNQLFKFQIIGFIYVVLAYTNPQKDIHKKAVLNNFIEKMNYDNINYPNSYKNLFIKLTEKIIDKKVKVNSFFIFSITTLKDHKQEDHNIGFGILGKVYVYQNTEKEFSK